MLTPRFFALALICPALLLLGEFFPFLTPIAILFGLALLALAWLDRRTAGALDQFAIKLEHDQKLSLGIHNPINM